MGMSPKKSDPASLENPTLILVSVFTFPQTNMSYSLNSLEEGYIGDYYRAYKGGH